MKTTDKLEELFIVVDENDKILGYKTRKECHSNKSLIHRSTAIAIYNKNGEIALQKRSKTKDLYPGFYTLSASGHVNKGETYEKTAIREMKEEIGINTPITYKGKYLYYFPLETEFTAVFIADYDGPFKINKAEVESMKFFSTEEIKNMRDKLTPSSIEDLRFIGVL